MVLYAAKHNRRDVKLEYSYDPDIAPIPNDVLEGYANELGIGDWEFSRTHWAIKDIDLFRVLLRHNTPRRAQPIVFKIAEFEKSSRTWLR